MFPLNNTITGSFYAKVLARPTKISESKASFWTTWELAVFAWKKPGLTLPSIEVVLIQHEFMEIQDPELSPHLSPEHVFLFPKLKDFMKGTNFYHVESIKKTVFPTLKRFPKEDFRCCFRNLYRRAQCITSGGSYFEIY